MNLALNDRQRFALQYLADHPDGTYPGWLGGKLQERFGSTPGNRSASERYGRSRAGLNTLRALERRGLVVEHFHSHGSSWRITAAGLAEVSGHPAGADVRGDE